MALRLRDHAVDRQHILLHRLRQVQVIPHDMLNPVQAGVMMVVLPVVMVMVVLVVMVVVMHGFRFLHAVHLHRHMGAADAAARHHLVTVDHVGDADGVQLRYRPGLIRHQLQQRRRQHIARRAHAAVQIQSFHRNSSIGEIALRAEFPPPEKKL